MKTATFVSALIAAAAAAPLEARDGPHGHGGMAGMAGMSAGAATTPAAPAAAGANPLSSLLGGGLDLGALLGGGPVDLGSLMQGMDMGKLLSSITPEMFAAFGPVMNKFLTTTTAYKIEELKPKLRSDAKRIKIIYGPYKLKGTETKGKVGNGFSFDPAGTGYFYMMDKDFPRDITIIDVKSKVTDDAFNDIDLGKGLYNHHAVFYDTSSKPTTITACGSGKSSTGIPLSIFMGGAAESIGQAYTSNDGKFNSGYYLSPNAKVTSMLDIVNYNKEEKMVYSVSEMEYVPGKIANVLPASAQIIDIGACSEKSALFVHPPEGKKQWTLNSANISMIQDGYFLQGKAHFHDGADEMVVFVNDKEVCRSKAQYGGEGREGKLADGTAWAGIAGTTECKNIIPIRKGDIMRFTATFDTAAHPEREQEGAHGEMEGMAEGMALFTGAFASEVPGSKTNYVL